MQNSIYYNLKLVEGTDIVNPLTVDVPNYEIIDEQMHINSVASVGFATELANGSAHAITRENSECSVFRFIATAGWKLGDSVSVDGVPVSALLPSGETLPADAYVINSNVLCILTGTILTIYAGKKKAEYANEIKYNDTTVESELNKLNSNLQLIKDNTSSIIIPTSQYQTNINTIASYAWQITPAETGIYSGIVSYGVGFGYEVGKITSDAGYIRFVNPNANAVPTEYLWSVINNVLQNNY